MSGALWTEKYRPGSIHEVVGQSTMKDMVAHMFNPDASVTQRYMMPHLILYGSSGTGKTSSLLGTCRDLFGPKLLADRMLHINASYDRGIQTVREQLKTFASRSLGQPHTYQTDNTPYPSNGFAITGRSNLTKSNFEYPCPPFKVAILEEADRLTVDAQCALRRIIEQYGDSTRFCFVCNRVSKIIDPIASRCQRIYFARIGKDVMIELLMRVASAERISYSEEAMHSIADAADGDMRKALNLLQAASVGCCDPQQGLGSNQAAAPFCFRLDPGCVADITGYALPRHIESVIRFIKRVETPSSTLTIAQNMLYEGVVMFECSRQLLDACLLDESMGDDVLHECIDALFDLRRQTSNGADSALSLVNAMHKMRGRNVQ